MLIWRAFRRRPPPVQTSVKQANRSENNNSSLSLNNVSSVNKNTQTLQNDVPRKKRAEVTQLQEKQQTSSDQNSAAELQKNLLDNLDQQKTSAQSGDRVEDTSQMQPQNSQKLNLTKKVLTTSLIETNSLSTTNGGFDEATWGKLDVNNWQGSVQDGVYQLTSYNGDTSHIIVPNEADFEKAGKSTNGLQVGIIRDTVRSLLSNQKQITIAFSKTNNQKVKAIGTDWSNTFSGDNAHLSKFDGSNLDVSNVTNMNRMFYNSSISDLTSLANWDTSKVTDMSNMLSGNSISDLIPLANWNTSNATNMAGMLSENKISDLTPLTHWNISKVTDMHYMFTNNQISDLTPLANWNVSNVTNMNWMFVSNSINDLIPLTHWDTSKVTNMGAMFYNNQISDLTPLTHWDTSKVTDMNSMFDSNSINDLTPLAHWDISKVTDMRDMFEINKVSDLTPLTHWDTSKVTDMNSMFYHNSISDLTPLANWNTSKVTDMRYMFGHNSISNLTPLTHWNTSNVTEMLWMFSNNSISDLTPLANWDTSKVTDMSYMFSHNLISDLTSLAHWDTGNVTDMSSMFYDNPDLIDLKPITNWHISGTSLFRYDTKLNLTNIKDDASLMQGFLKTPKALEGATFITNNADLVKATIGKDLPTLTNTAKRTITFNIPNATPETIVQTINYKATAPAVQVDFARQEIVQTYPVKESDWYLDTSNSNVTVNGQPSTEYKAYTLDPNGKDIDFAAIPLPKIPGYKAKILRIPSGNSAQPAMLLVSFVALPSVHPGVQHTPDNTKQDQDVISDTKDLNTSNMQNVSNQHVLLENADNNLQTLNVDIDTSTWQVEKSVADELIAPYVVFNSNYKLDLPRFDNYNLQIIKSTSNKDNLSFVYLNQDKTFKYVFNIKIEDGKYLLSISQIENKRFIPVKQSSFNDYHQLIELIVKLINK